MSEIKEGDVRTYRGALVDFQWFAPGPPEGRFLWEHPGKTLDELNSELAQMKMDYRLLDLARIPKHVLREAWGRTCEVTVRFFDEEVDVIDLKVIPTRKEQVARVLRLAAEILPNCGHNAVSTIHRAGVIAGEEATEGAILSLYAHLERTGRKQGYSVTWNAYEGKKREEQVDWCVFRAEQVQALLAAADEVEKGDRDE